MNNEQILNICDSLIAQLTVLKGFVQLNNMSKKIDHSIVSLQGMDNLDKLITELVKQLTAGRCPM